MTRPAQPSFFRLDATIGWRRSPISEGIEETPSDGTLRLPFVGERLSPLTDGSGAFGGLTLPTGVAGGPDGLILVADPGRRVILRYPNPAIFGPGGNEAPGFAPLWPAAEPAGDAPGPCALPTAPRPSGPHELISPRGLAFSHDGDLIVADAGDARNPGRLLVYTWPGMAVREVVVLEDGAPHDVAVDAHGHVFVADAAAKRVRRFDRLYREDRGWPGGSPELDQPKHLVFDADGRLFLVDLVAATGRGRLLEITGLGRVREVDEAVFWRGRYPAPVRLEGDRLHAPADPCAGIGAALRNTEVDRRGRLVPGGPTLLYRPPLGRRVRRGTFVTEALDSEAFEFAWHRLIFDMDLKGPTALEVRTFTAAQEIEPERIALLPEPSWSTRIVLTPEDPPELLVQSPPGRYLWLRITLIGDGVESPAIRAIELLGPRRASLRYLPAPFHEDPVSRDFLERFLSYFDTIFDEIEGRIERFAAEIDPDGAPAGAFLGWLASWFDVRFLAQWDAATRRAFLANAMKLHRTRGTVAGLRAALRLHLGLVPPMPALIEGFRLRSYAERRETGEPDVPDGSLRIAGYPLTEPIVSGDLAHRFAVVVPEAAAPTPERKDAIVRLVEAFKPAHTDWTLILARPGLRVGCQSTVGVDTLIGSYPAEPLDAMTLGQSSRLADRPSTVPRVGESIVRAGSAT